MSKRVLVAYASRTGSTAGVAEAIGETLTEGGAIVDVREVGAVTDLSRYDAVVVGSAIQSQKWLPEAMRFLQSNRTALARKPFATFTVCITMSMAGGKHRDAVSQWLTPARALVSPVSEGLFAGTLDFSKMPLLSRGQLMRLPVLLGIWRRGDHRDWEAIRAWATDLGRRFA